MTAPVSPLWPRPIPPGGRLPLLPRVPRRKGPPAALPLHLGHKEIQAGLTGSDLARAFAPIDAMRAPRRLGRIAKRPPGFLAHLPRGRRLDSARRRG